MSYNYDLNPWDDSPGANQSAGGQGQLAYGSGGPAYSDGYSNPAAQYAGDWTSDQQQYNYNDQGQQQPQQEDQPDQPDQPEQQPEPGGQNQEQAPESAFKRFLRLHVPLCGPLMNITSPLLDTLLKYVNRDLLVSKIFYFFFYSAFGSLFPLMGVYFKQQGMNPAQVGILTGVRPFIEIFSAPFWNNLAERFQKSKALLLFSLLSWIIFTYSLAHIRPPASACVAFNDTDYVLYTPYSDNDLSNYNINELESSNQATDGVKKVDNQGNEIFMKEMPGEKERILASEENENDQGRRRRRKRQVSSSAMDDEPANYRAREQIDRPTSSSKSRYIYSVDGSLNNGDDEGYQSHLELDVDLENDFDDSPIRERRPDENYYRGGGTKSSSEDSNSPDEALAEYDQPDQRKTLLRYRRFVVGGDQGEADESEGEAEAEEPKVKPARSREKEDWAAEEGENEESEQQEAGGGGGGGGAENEYENSNNRKGSMIRHNGNRNQQTTTMASTTVTAINNNNNNNIEETGSSTNVNKTKRIYKQRHKTPPTHIVGMSPITVQYAVNYNKDKHSQFVTPMFSTIVYKLEDIKEVFFLLLLLISLGEFFSAPAITIADSITLAYLGENTDHYGRQRMFGSLSWAITLLIVGMALDNSTSIADHPCGPHQRERSYTVCFAIFSLLMACAFLTATQFRFDYPAQKSSSSSSRNNGASQTMVTSTVDNNNNVVTTTAAPTSNVDDLYASTQPRNIFNTAPPVNAPPPGAGKEKFEFLDKWKSAMFAQRTRELPEWVNVFRQFFRDPLNLTYLFITWFLGCGVGLVFTFLFWHLQDIGGTPTLFGICSVINHISEILAYFFSSNFIKRFGHTKVSKKNNVDDCMRVMFEYLISIKNLNLLLFNH